MIKAVQIDLARQMETLPAIFEFIDLAAEHHFDTLLLYLEDRVKTASYPYPAPGEAYSVSEMKEIVAYAAARQLAVIPCVPALGHVERFLRHPEMLHLAELRGGEPNAFGIHTLQEYCPRTEAVYDFLQKYYSELAEIFPAPYFHLGQDEVHALGKCPLCRGTGEAQLFAESTVRAAEIVRSLGKRPMMWADMVDEYPELLDMLPRDVILVDWQYRDDSRRSVSHFLSQSVGDNLNTFRKAGFEVMIAPTTRCGNIRTFTEYAIRSDVSGYILTNWERAHSHQLRLYPTVVYAGELWNGATPEEALRRAATSIFGLDDPLFVSGLAAIFETDMCTRFGGDRIGVDGTVTTNFYGRKSKLVADEKFFLAFLESFRAKITSPLGNLVLADMILALNSALLNQELRDFFSHAVELPWGKEFDDTVAAFRRKLEAHHAQRLAAWHMLRPGITPVVPESDYESTLKALETLVAKLRSDLPRLRVRFSLANQWGCEFSDIFLRYGSEWKKIAGGCFKSTAETTDTIYEKFFFPDSAEVPNALKMEFHGYGGVGVCHAQLSFADGRVYAPKEVLATSGEVYMAEKLLSDSASFAWFGAQQEREGEADCRAKAAALHTVEVSLTERRTPYNYLN